MSEAGPVDRWLGRLCRASALAGGAVLLAMAGMTVFSVTGRSLAGTPVAGDFELVEVGTAIAVFLFLPLAQWRRSHATVDVLAGHFPAGVRRGVQVVSDLLLAGIGALLVWRMSLGGLEMAASGETTMVLAMPRWWAFPVIVPAAALLTAVALRTAVLGEPEPEPDAPGREAG